MSLPEVLLWCRLRARQPGCHRVRRQHAVGPYILDFYCSALKLAIEIDGICHASEAAGCHDRRRTEYLERQGIRVMRYQASSVLNDLDEVCAAIADMLRKGASESGSWERCVAQLDCLPPPRGV